MNHKARLRKLVPQPLTSVRVRKKKVQSKSAYLPYMTGQGSASSKKKQPKVQKKKVVKHGQLSKNQNYRVHRVSRDFE